MSRFIDLTGRKFARLTVIALSEIKNRQTRWECECECGNKVVVLAGSIKSGNTKSCGCLRNSLVSNLKRRHSIHGTPIYRTWRGMIQRCYDANSQDFSRYGGRGIKVCEFLRASPLNLFSVMGDRPTTRHSIDRIKNNGHYSCGACAQCLSESLALNVRWATPREQARNRERNIRYTFNGETKLVAEWAEQAGIKYMTFYQRMKRGDDPFKVTA